LQPLLLLPPFGPHAAHIHILLNLNLTTRCHISANSKIRKFRSVWVAQDFIHPLIAGLGSIVGPSNRQDSQNAKAIFDFGPK